MHTRLMLLITLLLYPGVPLAFAEGSGAVVSFTFEAIADCSDLAYRARPQAGGTFSFELVAARKSDSVAPTLRPTNDELLIAFQKIRPYDQRNALVLRLIKDPRDALRHTEHSGTLKIEPPACVVVSVGTSSHYGPREGSKPGHRAAVRAISQRGIYVSSMDEAIEIARSRFSMRVDTSRCYHNAFRLTVFRDPLEESIWFYDPPPEGMEVPTREEMELAKKAYFHISSFDLENHLFFHDDTFRDPLLRMFRAGDADERRYAAFRLRAYPDDEVVNELSRVVDSVRSSDRSADQVALAAEQSLHAMGKRQSISQEALTTFDSLSQPSLGKDGIYELDVDKLRSKWGPKSQSNKLIGVMVAVCFATSLLAAIATIFHYRRKRSDRSGVVVTSDGH